MKKITRILSSVMAISMLSMPLAACSSSESASPASPAESQSSAASSGVIEISFPTFMCGTASQTEWCAQRVEAFNTEYEGKYKVIVEEIPGDQNYIDKLKVLYSADDLPDVIVTGGYNLIDMMKDKLVDLTPYLDEDTEWKGQLSSVGVNVNSRDGQLYAIPYIRQVIGYYYNKDLFAQAGIEAPPETWEEFEADCDKLLAAGITPISMDTADSGWCTSLLMGAMIGQTDTGEKFMNTNQPDSFVNDDVIQAAARIQKMFQNYTTTDAIGGEYGAAANNFFNEKICYYCKRPLDGFQVL